MCMKAVLQDLYFFFFYSVLKFKYWTLVCICISSVMSRIYAHSVCGNFGTEAILQWQSQEAPYCCGGAACAASLVSVVGQHCLKDMQNKSF